MSEEQLKELQEYNLEYLEAQQNEEIFGGDYISVVELKYAKKEIERLNKENEKLKNGLYKLLQLNKYMIHFSSKKTINKLIVKQRDLIYELLEGRPRGIMFGSKGVDKE